MSFTSRQRAMLAQNEDYIIELLSEPEDDTLVSYTVIHKRDDMKKKKKKRASTQLPKQQSQTSSIKPKSSSIFSNGLQRSAEGMYICVYSDNANVPQLLYKLLILLIFILRK